MTLQIDHLVVACRDLDATATSLRAALGDVPEIPHAMADWGTSSRILLLSDSAIEVIAVTDPAAAAANPIGQHLLRMVQEGDRLAQLCVRSDDLTSHCARLRIAPPTAAGDDLYGGFLESVLAPGLPFFVQRPATPATDGPTISHVEVGVANRDRLAAFLDDGTGPGPDVRVVDGAPGLRRAVLRGTSGEVVLQDGLDHVLVTQSAPVA
jgi:hypothetical protein